MTPEATQGAPAPRQFKTQLDAVQWLRMQGFKCSRSTFNGHFKAGKVCTNAAGCFEASALLGYAAVHLTPLAQAGDARAREAALKKLDSDGDLKAVRAARERLRLTKEQGELMTVARHEEELAARALFFKAEIESFIQRRGADIIALVRGEQAQLHALMLWWGEQTADWMDAWTRSDSFVSEDDENDSGEEQPWTHRA